MKRFLLWVFLKVGIGGVWIPRRVRIEALLAVKEVDRIPGVISGDYRRSVALGRLLKRVPGIEKRVAAMAIEYEIYRGAV